MTPLTTEQLAARVRPHRDRAKTVERIRHWVRAGLIRPLNAGPGKGTARLFDPATILDVAVLSEIVEIPGMSILEPGPDLSFAVATARDAAYQWTRDGKRRWLELSWMPADKQFTIRCIPHVHVDVLHSPEPGAKASIILPLSEILARVRFGGAGALTVDDAGVQVLRAKKPGGES